MASKTISQANTKLQKESPRNTKVESNSCRSSQNLKPRKSDCSTTEKMVEKNQNVSKYALNGLKKDNKSDHHQKESFENSTDEVPTEVPLSSETCKKLPSDTRKQSLEQGDAGENRTTIRDGNEDQAKKSEHSGNDSFVSAKFSDENSSVTADFVESGKSSMCRPSTNSDVSDESSCSSLSSSITKPHKSNDSRAEAIKKIHTNDGVLGFNHFRVLKKLGSGDIGSVYLSELRGTKSYFAMKVMDKGLLASRKKLLRAQTEREILQCLDHPFLPTLYTHFKTDKFSCLVMDFCPGGDLHTLRQRQPGKHFSEQAVKFYVAEILLALEYLHMLGIIYRDLKPENILVREDGHIMLSDFDLSLRCVVNPTLIKSSNPDSESARRKNTTYCIQPACIEPSCIQPSCVAPTTCFGPRLFSKSKFKERKAKSEIGNQVNPLPELIAEPTYAHSMSFVGTHEYLAPEIIKGNGHGSAVDWWTLGIFMYELLFGKTPFKGSGTMATLFNVIGQPLRFPEFPTVSFAARDLIRGLLVKEPQNRLAYKRGASEIKQHPFFEGVNWALIRCASPPEIPKSFDTERLAKPGVSASEKTTSTVNQKGSNDYLEFDFF